MEFKPTFEQLSQEMIIDEINKDISFLKSFETLIQDRAQAYSQYSNVINRSKHSAEDSFQYVNPDSHLQALLLSYSKYTEMVCYMHFPNVYTYLCIYIYYGFGCYFLGSE